MSYSIIAKNKLLDCFSEKWMIENGFTDKDEDSLSLEFKIDRDYTADNINDVISWDEVLIKIEKEKIKIVSNILMLNMYDAQGVEELNEKKELFDSYIEDYQMLSYQENNIFHVQSCIRDEWKIKESF